MPAKDFAFAQRLKELLVREKLKQADAAHKCGITVTSLQNYLSGRLPQPAQAKAIAEAFNVPLSWLIDGGENKQILVSNTAIQVPSLGPDIADALDATRRTPASFARQLHTTPEELEAWMSGTTVPGYEQLAALLHLVVPVALAHSDHEIATSKRKKVA